MEMENDNIMISEDVLRKIITKLLSIMNDEQHAEIVLWLNEMNLRLEDLKDD